MHCVRSTFEPCIRISRHVTGLVSASFRDFDGLYGLRRSRGCCVAGHSFGLGGIHHRRRLRQRGGARSGTAGLSTGAWGADAQPANRKIPATTRDGIRCSSCTSEPGIIPKATPRRVQRPHVGTARTAAQRTTVATSQGLARIARRHCALRCRRAARSRRRRRSCPSICRRASSRPRSICLPMTPA